MGLIQLLALFYRKEGAFVDVMTDILEAVNTFLYSYILIALLVFTGIYFTIRTKGVQLRLLGEAIKVIAEPKHDQRGISSFQALMISTASRVGTGNIAGVATAIASGGPGAIFWMWAMAIIGGASAFIESTLAQVYKIKVGEIFRGGPAYYMQYGLGKRWLGIVFAVLLILCFGYGFNGLQSFNATSAFEFYLGDQFATGRFPQLMGVVMAGATAFVIFGGVHRISFMTSVVVPTMALGYMGLGFFIIVKNAAVLPMVFSAIFAAAFDWQAIFGGFAGSCVAYGVKRGLFSNEAGMGSAPNAAASANVSHPAKQGLVQMLSVFIDTLLICSTTAIILLVSGLEGSPELTGMPFVQQAVYEQVGIWGIHFITFSILAFAFSSIIGNYYYAESNLLFIKESRTLLNLFRLSVVAMVFFSATASFDFVWNLADVLMGMMALVNIAVILIMGNIALLVLADYMRQKNDGQEPVFCAKDVGLDTTQQWK